jgi:hypothetical protein
MGGRPVRGLGGRPFWGERRAVCGPVRANAPFLTAVLSLLANGGNVQTSLTIRHLGQSDEFGEALVVPAGHHDTK